MSTLYSCIVCGDDVSEDAQTFFDQESGCEMPHCYFCGEVVRQHSDKFDEFRKAFKFAKMMGPSVIHDPPGIGH